MSMHLTTKPVFWCAHWELRLAVRSPTWTHFAVNVEWLRSVWLDNVDSTLCLSFVKHLAAVHWELCNTKPNYTLSDFFFLNKFSIPTFWAMDNAEVIWLFYHLCPGQLSLLSDIQIYWKLLSLTPLAYRLYLENFHSWTAKECKFMLSVSRQSLSLHSQRSHSITTVFFFTFSSRFLILIFWWSSWSCCSFTAFSRLVIVFSCASITSWKCQSGNCILNLNQLHLTKCRWKQ